MLICSEFEMEYINKLYLNHVEKKSENDFYDHKERKIKMKNCCKRWSSNMDNKSIMSNYKNIIYESTFLKKMENFCSFFFKGESKGKLLLHQEDENIYSLPNFLIIDNATNKNMTTITINKDSTNSDDVSNMYDTISGDNTANTSKNVTKSCDYTNINECDNNFNLNKNHDKQITNKNIYLSKKFINIYHKHDDTYSFYDKEIDDFLVFPNNLTTYNENINTIQIFDTNYILNDNLIIKKTELEHNEENDEKDNNTGEKTVEGALNKCFVNNEIDNGVIVNEQNVISNTHTSVILDNGDS